MTNILYERLMDSNIQTIITSNDRFLINTVNLNCINILGRNGQIVKAYNYKNNKKVFKDFKYTGLNNFDLFSGEILNFKEDLS